MSMMQFINPMKRVKDIRNLITQNASTVREDASLLKIAEAIVEDQKTRAVYVINNENKLVGIIPVNEIIQYIYYEHIPEEYILYRFPVILSSNATAKDIMLPPVYVYDHEELTSALVKMFKNNLEELPVVDNEMHIVGDLSVLELISAWVHSVKNAD